jgi:capsule polysaccharide export protein KpsE/RkpR
VFHENQLWQPELIALSFWFPARKYSNYYLGILNCRTIADSIVSKHDLQTVYRAPKIEDAIEILRRHVDIKLDDEGIIHIWVTDRSPERSAAIANDFVSQLERKVMELEVEKAKSNRVFIAGRLSEVAQELRDAEELLEDFRSTYGVVFLPSQVEMAISHWAELRAKVMALEVKKRVLESYQSDAHPQLSLVNRELVQLNQSLDYAQSSSGNEQDRFFVPLENIPLLDLQYARLKREALLKENLYQLLAQEHERAKIEESRDTPLIIVLDRAIVPDQKYKPNRVIIVFSGGLLGFLVAGVFMVSYEYVQSLRAANSPDQLVSEAL